MKRYLSIWIILLLIATSGGFATLADDVDDGIITIQGTEQYYFHFADAAFDGTFLLTGYIYLTEATPALMSINANGEVLWSMNKDVVDPTWGMYRSACYLDKDTIVVVCSSMDVPDRVECIRNGELVFTTDPIEMIFDVAPTEGGFIVCGSPSRSSAVIRKIGMDGEPLWTASWDEPIRFTGILPDGDGYLAFGIKNTGPELDFMSTTSVIVGIDHQGNTLWRHDSSVQEGLSHGIRTESGRSILLGDDDQGKSFAAEYDENGLVWKTDTSFVSRYSTRGDTKAILSTENGVLIALSPSDGEHTELKLLSLDASGEVLRSWSEDIGDITAEQTIALHRVNDKAYLLVCGFYIDNLDWEDKEPNQSILIIKEIPAV